MKGVERVRQMCKKFLLVSLVTVLFISSGSAWGENKAEKTVNATITDTQGVETDVRNLLFYWEEKVSETAFVPHEQKHVPVKRGTTTVSVRFDTIKQIDAKPGPDKSGLVFIITLTNGKTGEFTPAINGSFKGESEFGQIEVPVNSIAKVVFK